MADCLLCLVDLPQSMPAQINLLPVTNSDGPTFNTRRQMCQCLSVNMSTSQPDIMPDPTPKSLTADRLKNSPTDAKKKLTPSAKESPST